MLVCAVAVLAAAAVAVGALRDPLAGIDPPEPATERGRAHAFDVERDRDRAQPADLGRRRARRPARAVGARAARPRRPLRDGRRSTVLDLTGRVTTGAEQGLLGLAFHPDFATDRRLYLHWSDRARRHARGRVPRRPPRSRELLHVDQPEPNHNGGQLAFGPDGRLYVGLGDGGGAFDPERRAQDLGDQLGKLLSTDVDGDAELARRADRPAQPVALRVRPRARRGLDRRRRPGRHRGDRPRAARARRAAQEPRLERLRGHRADGGGRRLADRRRARVAGRPVHARRRLLGHRRLRLPGHRSCRGWPAATCTATSARASCGR